MLFSLKHLPISISYYGFCCVKVNLNTVCKVSVCVMKILHFDVPSLKFVIFQMVIKV